MLEPVALLAANGGAVTERSALPMSAPRRSAGRQVGLALRPASAICPAMCNDFGNRVPYDDYLRAFSEIRVPLRWPIAGPNLEPRDDIWPTKKCGNSPKLVMTRCVLRSDCAGRLR